MGHQSSVFAVNTAQTRRQDRSYYKSLYNFNPNVELADYTLPVISNKVEKDKKIASGVVNTTQLPPLQADMSQNISAVDGAGAGQVYYDQNGNPIAGIDDMEAAYGEEMNEYDDEEQDEEHEEDANEEDLEYDDFRNIIESNEDAENNQLTELRKANFIRRGTPIWHLQKGLKTGEHAISFFAKHGNNMPIKFLNCNRKKLPPSLFRPYDLVVVDEDEDVLDMEYFTISAQGVVQIYADKRKNKMTVTPTEFLTLSEWMQQSTMFNVLTSMKFFKHYLIGKVFNLWKGNVRYRMFNKTRQDLAKGLIQTRPDFLPSYMDINRILYEMQCRQTFSVQRATRQFEIEDFIAEQKTHREGSKSHYSDRVEDIINNKLSSLVGAICESRTLREEEDLENTKMGQAQKNKSMVLQKKEEELKNRVMRLAHRNHQDLGTFIRLIDYMVVETQVRINQESAQLILDEMQNTSKKYSITTVVGFEPAPEDGMNFTPAKSEFVSQFDKLLNDMQQVTEEVVRVISHQDFHQYIHGLITDSGPRFKSIVEESYDNKQIKKDIDEKIASDFQLIEQSAKSCENVRDVYEFDQTFSFEDFKSTNQDLESIRQQLDRFQKWNIAVNKSITVLETRGLISISGRKLRDQLSARVQLEQTNMRTYLYELAMECSNNLTSSLSKIQNDLSKPITNLVSYVEFVSRLKLAKEELKANEEDKKKLEEMKVVLSKYRERNEGLTSVSTTNANVSTLQSKIDHVNDKIKAVEKVIDEGNEKTELQKEGNIEQLQTKIEEEQDRLNDQIEKIESESLMNKNTVHKDALDELARIKKKYDDSLKKIGQYQAYQDTLGLPDSPIPQIKQFEDKFGLRHQIWYNRDTFKKDSYKWFNEKFKDNDAEEVAKEIKRFEKMNLEMKVKMRKDFKDEVLETLTNEVRAKAAYINLYQALGNKAMKPKHWVKVFALLEQPPGNPDIVQFQHLIQDGIENHTEAIDEISALAQGQKSIEDTLDNVKNNWEDQEFVVIPYRNTKDRFLIADIEDIITLLEDDSMTVGTMMGSKYVADIRGDVEIWEKKLSYIGYIIDEWLIFQKNWIYLENIFNAEDIQKQLPTESKQFFQVDKFWKEHMSRANKNPKVLDFCDSGGLLKKFQENNKRLEDITKALEQYLGTKRSAFPRFFFLSNDELLEILSQTRNVQAVQPHLMKCFDAIKKIKFTEEKDSKEIIGMYSSEGEYVAFSKSVFAFGAVEDWLTDIEKMMTQSLYDETKTAFENYPADGTQRDEWLFTSAAQPILTIDMVMWTAGVTEAIDQIQKGKDREALLDFLKFSGEQLKAMVNLVRGDLKPLQRMMMGALIVIDVHAEEVVNRMIKERVESLNSFDWTCQLRYYWEALQDRDGDPYKGDNTDFDCFAKQTNTRFRYGYEYLGNSPRLVITPLTDKCYMTLTGALHLCFGGNPQGPAGTGKTETTKDLGKALAIQCVVFNCSDQLEVTMMSRFFVGLASGGAWSCFDEFNRINIEVLSVIAQQILTIQQAVRERKEKFDFEGTIIPLNLRFGVFITMNPGYAGRTELPDNLKALFRPISMMIPDYGLIAQIILFSEGFETAPQLARKMVKLYSLSSEQLSKQDHYDFGMRAVKSVLVMAGKLRRQESTLREDQLLIRAMRDSNVPKFLSHDLPLFEGIINDLFPGIEESVDAKEELREAIGKQLRLQKLQIRTPFINKIIQLIETMYVRHGNMVVGSTGTGKTTVSKILGAALTTLHKDGTNVNNPWYKNVRIDTLNPKAVTMGELFGEVNKHTNEWAEGIVSKLVKDAVDAQEGTDPEAKRWINFDGPVDALWIENMNTVLDDNKMLCLSSGQRIRMPDTCTMMFEVNDLAVASPATVSRCGMVYMEPLHLGWDPHIETWKEKMVDIIVQPYLDQVANIVMEVFTKMLPIMRKQCKEIIQTVDSNIVQSCLRLLQCFLDKERINLENKEKTPNPEKAVLNYVAFSLIWSLGANIHEDSRILFGEYFRIEMRKHMEDFPDSDVYEYGLDTNRHQLESWSEQISDFKFDPERSFFEILVPTSDTAKYKFLLNTLMYNSFNVLFIGETGVGKSVITNDFLMTAHDNFVSASVNFSGKTTSNNLQSAFEDKLEERRKNLLGPPSGKKMIFFIDDINMPQKEKYGAQPPIELLRQTIDSGGFYDIKRLFFKRVADTSFVAAAAPPGGGRNEVTPRLFRHFNMIWIPQLSEQSMRLIFTSILRGFLELKEEGDLAIHAEDIIKSGVQIYMSAISDFLPTPTKCHYTFNLRDMSKVIQGMLMSDLQDIEDNNYLFNLYLSETFRVFRDRLVDHSDRDKFNKMSHDIIESHLDLGWELKDFQNVLFGDFEDGGVEKRYLKLSPPNELNAVLQQHLELYNTENSKMNLVFFDDCIQHLSRVARILKQDRGNAMLVGVGGSGRRSMAQLGAHLNSMTTFQVQITKSFKEKEFHEKIKELLRTTAIDDKKMQFLFSDTQIVQESFLEDINNLLNSGEIPNLFPPDEKSTMCDELAEKNREKGLHGKDQIYAYFVQLCRDNLHIVLAFSPVGEQFRNRCRQFPSIINCCTIDWYNEWPEEALYSVAYRQFQANETILGIQDHLDILCRSSVHLHQSVRFASENYFSELRRRNYTTPTSYLDLIKTYIEQLKKQKAIVPVNIQRYQDGLTRLDETNLIVTKLNENLKELIPQIEKNEKETQQMVINLEEQTGIAQEKEKINAKDEAASKKIYNEVMVIKLGCEEVLNEAMPALKKAKASLEVLKKGDIDEMKGYANPPPDLVMVLNAVCLLKGEKQEWSTAVKLMSKGQVFIDSLKSFDPKEIKERTLKALKKYVNDPRFEPDLIAQKGMAAKSVCMWVKAMDKYAEVLKIVEPKQKDLSEAQTKLDKAEKELKVKQASLQMIRNKIANLQDDYKHSQQKLENLTRQQENVQLQLSRAEKLVVGLADEKARWAVSITQLDKDLGNMMGNTMLAAGYISYVGTFTQKYRMDLLTQWKGFLVQNKFPFTPDFSVKNYLGDPVQIRDWNIKGLPADDLSIENGIIATSAKRWPLIVDPQSQGNKWIRNMEKDNQLMIIKLSNPKFMTIIENAIRQGLPVLLENIDETLDPTLEPVLANEVEKINAGQNHIKLADGWVPYSSDFKFMITTKLANPHYLPEICIKVTVINFTVTTDGLEDQLLVEVVRYEQPELEQLKDQLIIQLADFKRQLKEIEDKILKMVSEADEDILNDEELIITLDQSKQTSIAINERMKEAEKASIEIAKNRENYRPVARRGSVLYFVIADLANIDPMYQYSLDFFTKLFVIRLEKSEKAEEVDKRLKILIDDITRAFYFSICRGLFERHKLLYSFLNSTSILRRGDEINVDEWNFFLRGSPTDFTHHENKCSDFLPDATWYGLFGLEECAVNFKDITKSLQDTSDKIIWKEIMKTEDPHLINLPPIYEDRLTAFQKCMLLKVLRDSKLQYHVKKFVKTELGAQYIESPPFDLEGSLADSINTTPIIFVLSAGADPIAYLKDLAEKQGKKEQLKAISLGQGQGVIAEKMIQEGVVNGLWICLQNCHLSASWMPSLEKIQEKQDGNQMHPDYRLWLTSMPSADFPVPVLQSGIKITNEPPKGLKANIKRTFQDLGAKRYEEMKEKCGEKKGREYKKLVFALAYFHAAILERRKYGAIGWNISYEWMNSDFDTSERQLFMYLEEQNEVPYQALNYLVARVNYGGRVTDDKDERLIVAMLKKYFTAEIMNDNYKLSSLSTYYAPADGSYGELNQYIAGLPLDEDPEVFGLHSNANMEYENNTVTHFMDTILVIQPRITGGKAVKTPEEIVTEMAEQFTKELPEDLNFDKAHPKTFERTANDAVVSLGVFVDQEIQRFNKLLKVIRKSLVQLVMAIEGTFVMSQELENMFNAFLDNKVPENWTVNDISYPSLKPLSSWYKDLLERIDFIGDWLYNGPPKSYWLSAFFFPQGFMTATLQTYARQTLKPIDTLAFKITVQSFGLEGISEAPEIGVHIHGLYMQGAKWDFSNQTVADSDPKVPIVNFPVVSLEPFLIDEIKVDRCYPCPLYKTSLRQGQLSTTGHSTNFVGYIQLPRNEHPSEYWIRRGTCLLCMTDN